MEVRFCNSRTNIHIKGIYVEHLSELEFSFSLFDFDLIQKQKAVKSNHVTLINNVILVHPIVTS